MRTWMVTIRDVDGPHWSKRSQRYYVVAKTQKSAVQQAKRMAGYSIEEALNRAGVDEAIVLETLT